MIHPPMPQPVLPPVHVKVRVLTPAVTKAMNEKVDKGKEEPYTYFGTSEKHYLDVAKWLEKIKTHVKELHRIIEHYKNQTDELAK